MFKVTTDRLLIVSPCHLNDFEQLAINQIVVKAFAWLFDEFEWSSICHLDLKLAKEVELFKRTFDEKTLFSRHGQKFY